MVSCALQRPVCSFLGNALRASGGLRLPVTEQTSEFPRSPLTCVTSIACCVTQGEVWPNRCSTAIDTANELLQKSVQGQERMHYIDMGPVRLSGSVDLH